MLQANALYAEYKAANAVALATFADDALDQTIALREQYARKFLDYEDTGAHRAYIGILRRVRSIYGAYRRTAYNRWMTESAYFSDFVEVTWSETKKKGSGRCSVGCWQFMNTPSLRG